MQSRVCELEHQLHQLESQHNSNLQDLRDAMNSLQQKEQELAVVLASQKLAQQQGVQLQQVTSDHL